MRELREAAGLTQRQLADHVGVTDQTISNIEREGSQPTLETALLIARFFGVPAERIFLPAGSNDVLDNSAQSDGTAARTAPPAALLATSPVEVVENPEPVR